MSFHYPKSHRLESIEDLKDELGIAIRTLHIVGFKILARMKLG